MSDRDSTYDRMDRPRLYGRGELLDALMAQFDAGCTLFGMDGVGGAGKTEVASRFIWFVGENRDRHVCWLNASEWQSEDLLIAAMYMKLREIPSKPDEIENIGRTILNRAVGSTRNILAAAFQDALNYANDKLGHTAEAIKKEITGEGADRGVAGLLQNAASSNQRLFIREYMTFVADLGNLVIIGIDNYEDAEPSGQEFVRFLLNALPPYWALVVVDNIEKPSKSDWQRRLAPSIEYQGGRVFTVDTLDRASIAEWFEADLRREPRPEELDQILRYTNGGRPNLIADYLSALRARVPLPDPPDLSRLNVARRNERSPGARRIAELIAVAPADALIPLDLLAQAAAAAGVDHTGAAIDELEIASEVVVSDGIIGFSHSSRRDGWRAGMSEAEVQRALDAWYEVYGRYVPDVRSFARAGLIPALSSMIVAREDGAQVTAAARELLAAGVQNEALSLLDASWQAEGGMTAVGGDVIDHALIAAQTRLDLGRYGDAQEALHTIDVGGRQTTEQAVSADLIRLKLALRQNAYVVVWLLSAKLLSEAGKDARIQLERELVVNAALRDLCDNEKIQQSVAWLQEASKNAPPSLRAKAHRSVARSLAKLGRPDEAIAVAQDSLRGAEGDGDVRAIGNAKLAMAEAFRYADRIPEAIEAYREGESIGRGSGNRDSELWCILGRACANLQAGEFDKALVASASARRIVTEPGFEHPLESAHVGLIDLLADLLSGGSGDRSVVLAAYDDLQIRWPHDYVEETASAGRLPGPVPI